MSEIMATVRIKIHEGKLDEFKRLVARSREMVRAKEPGTLQHDVFLSDDQTESFTHERYRDSEAFLEHGKNLGETMDDWMGIGTISGEVCGSVSPELRKNLEAAGVRIYKPFLLLK